MTRLEGSGDYGQEASVPSARVATAYLCVKCSRKAGGCACDGPTFRFTSRPAIEDPMHPQNRLLVAAKSLCEALVRNGFGLTSDRPLPGEFDTLVDAIEQASPTRGDTKGEPR